MGFFAFEGVYEKQILKLLPSTQVGKQTLDQLIFFFILSFALISNLKTYMLLRGSQVFVKPSFSIPCDLRKPTTAKNSVYGENVGRQLFSKQVTDGPKPRGIEPRSLLSECTSQLYYSYRRRHLLR